MSTSATAAAEILALRDNIAFRGAIRRWFADNLKAVRERFPEGTSDFDPPLRRAWEDHVCRSGWSGLSWPVEYGGKNLPLDRLTIFHEESALSGALYSMNAIGHGILGPTLMVHGSEAQKRRHLSKILLNTELWCQGYSEPGSGSDLASLTTRAQREGDHYVIRGQKIWTSFADAADWCFMLVRTDSQASRHRGISAILVDMRSPGVTVRPIRQMVGEAEFCQMFFDDVRIPIDNRLGEENHGWEVAMTASNFERSTNFIPRIARLQVELLFLVQLAKEAGVRGRPGLDDALVRDRLARLFLDIHALRLQNHRILARNSRGTVPGPESSCVKVLWSETHQRLLEFAIELLGPGAQLGPQEARAPRLGRWQRDYLWSRAETILAGTSEIQRNIIGERALGLPR